MVVCVLGPVLTWQEQKAHKRWLANSSHIFLLLGSSPKFLSNTSTNSCLPKIVATAFPATSSNFLSFIGRGGSSTSVDKSVTWLDGMAKEVLAFFLSTSALLAFILVDSWGCASSKGRNVLSIPFNNCGIIPGVIGQLLASSWGAPFEGYACHYSLDWQHFHSVCVTT